MSIGINVADSIKFIQSFYNTVVGFKVSTEENLVREKKKSFTLLQTHKYFTLAI